MAAFVSAIFLLKISGLYSIFTRGVLSLLYADIIANVVYYVLLCDTAKANMIGKAANAANKGFARFITSERTASDIFRDDQPWLRATPFRKETKDTI